jgi:hypothetical protein
VEEICDQAVKEEKMEDTLRRMGSTWEVRERVVGQRDDRWGVSGGQRGAETLWARCRVGWG